MYFSFVIATNPHTINMYHTNGWFNIYVLMDYMRDEFWGRRGHFPLIPYYHKLYNTLPIILFKWLITASALVILITTKRLLCTNYLLPFGFIYLFLFYVGSIINFIINKWIFYFFMVLLEIG